MKNRKIDFLSFWKRSPYSVETIDQITLSFQGQTVVDDKGNECDKEKVNALLYTLFVTCEIEKTPEQYQAFLYEDDTKDFTLKFFLVIHYNDCTYFAVKGIHPFQQPHFKDIQTAFAPYFENR